jgi:hypothetical protein
MSVVQWDDAILALSPYEWYKFDEAAGLPQDSSGNARHMTTASLITYNQASLIPNKASAKSFFKPDGSSLVLPSMTIDFSSAAAALTMIMPVKYDAVTPSESIKFYRFGGSLTPAVIPAGSLTYTGSLNSGHSGSVLCNGAQHLVILAIGGLNSGLPFGGGASSCVIKTWVDNNLSTVTGPCPYAVSTTLAPDIGTASSSGIHTGHYGGCVVLNRMITDAEADNVWKGYSGIDSGGGGGGGVGSRVDQTMAALAAKGYTTGSIQDRQAAYLRAKTGLSKTSADMQKADGRVVKDLLLASTVT